MKFSIFRVTTKTLFIKTILFLIGWTGAFMLVNEFWPHLIDLTKVVTNIFSNLIVFLICYILTVIGFRYSSKDDKNE